MFDIGSDIKMRRLPHQMRRRIGVPKGILRHIVLPILSQGPMSGSELMDEINYYTDWRPSPGSIYPLLSQLKEDGMIEPHPDEDPSLKRFKITEKGLAILEEQKRHDEHFRRRQRSIRKIYWRLHREMPEEMYESFSSLLDTVEETYTKASASPEAEARFREVLDEATRQLTEIVA
jgi:DNA-binding PadR family transcriptional regulator